MLTNLDFVIPQRQHAAQGLKTKTYCFKKRQNVMFSPHQVIGLKSRTGLVYLGETSKKNTSLADLSFKGAKPLSAKNVSFFGRLVLVVICQHQFNPK